MAFTAGRYLRATGTGTNVQDVALAVSAGELLGSVTGAHVPDAAAATGIVLTDNSGGAASQTLAAIVGGGAGCEDTTKNAIASLADEVNKLIADRASDRTAINLILSRLEALTILAAV